MTDLNNIFHGMETDLQVLINRCLPTDRKLKRVDICLLKWELPEVEKKCISQIIDNTDYPYKLTILDTRELSKIEGFQCGINTSKIWNYFIKNSTCDYVCIIDTDAFVEKDWLTEIMKIFESDSSVGLVAPVSNNRGVPPEQDLTDREFWKDKNTNHFEAPSHISGYCFVLKKEMIDETGLFDEDFYYFGQDSDFCERVHENSKWKILICPTAVVNHGEDFKWSFSSTKANLDDKRLWDWHIDTKYAQELTQKKKELRGYNRKLYPWGGIAHQEFLKKQNEEKI